MAKSELTKELELEILRTINKMSCFACNEVGIVTKVKKPSKWRPEIMVDKLDTEIVDVLMYDQYHDEFRAYEIKISLSDFNSKSKKSFIGNYNYYVMPIELYEKVKDKIPPEIGVYTKTGQYRYLTLVKKAKKQALKYDKEKLLLSLVRSLHRTYESKLYEHWERQFL